MYLFLFALGWGGGLSRLPGPGAGAQPRARLPAPVLGTVVLPLLALVALGGRPKRGADGSVDPRTVTSARPRWFVDVHRENDTVSHVHRHAGQDGQADSFAAGRVIAAVDLYWLPLGAGGHFVRLNGRVFEGVAARLAHRSTCDLYHSALEVRVPDGRFVIEQAPVRDERGDRRGVVAEGPVGGRWAGRIRIFRYEIRRWRDGTIPDAAEAVESPRRLTHDRDRARRVLELAPRVPTPVWGRDELQTGDMWNSNSVISWLIARSGIDVESIEPPAGGRAPGWRAGLVLARRQELEAARASGDPPTGPASDDQGPRRLRGGQCASGRRRGFGRRIGKTAGTH